MTAPFSDELLSAYLDGELNAEERAYVETQLRERVELRRLCDELRALRASLQAMPVARPPENFAERVLRQAERQMLADSSSCQDGTANDAQPSEEPVELLKRSWLDDPRWRTGIGVVAGLAACVLAMLFLYPPAALQNGRNVALHPDGISQPNEGMSKLDSEFRASSADSFSSSHQRDILVRGREESLGFAEDSAAAKSAPPAMEMPAMEAIVPSAPAPPSTESAAPPELMQHDDRAGVEQEYSFDAAAGEPDSLRLRMSRDGASASTRKLAAGAKLGDATSPESSAGGANRYGVPEDRGGAIGGQGSALPGGMPGGGLGSGGMGGMGGSMGGGGGMGGEPMRGATELRFGQAADAPADAAPSNAPAADLADDTKYLYAPDSPPPTLGSVTESTYFALPFEPNAWTGTPVTTESLEQCTTQLEQARFLFVKVTVPEGVQEESPSAATAEPGADKAVAENLFRKLHSAEQAPLDFRQVPSQGEPSNRAFGTAQGMPQQVLVVDASSDMIRKSIDQLVSQPEVSVELATDDSTVARQLAEQQAGLELRQHLSEQLEQLKVVPEMDQAPQQEPADLGMVKNGGQPDGEGKMAEAEADAPSEANSSSEAGLERDKRAKDKLAEGNLAKENLAEKKLAVDKPDAEKVPTLGRRMRAAGEVATIPVPAQPQDPAPASERPAAPPAPSPLPAVVRSDAQTHDEATRREEMAGKPAASLGEKGVAPDRVVFYILYRLAPGPAPAAPAAPADAAGDR
jgi:hypothetical protein